MSYFKATVKEVPSGDSITLVGAAKPGTIPAEKRLVLSSLIAPKLVRVAFPAPPSVL
jgi:tRNA(Ile2) C34 agmatinyltransferase TiaS